MASLSLPGSIVYHYRLNYHLQIRVGPPRSRGQIYEIGGKDVMTYAELMLVYARLRGLKRLLFTLPVVLLRLMAFGVDKLTPVPANVARPLIEGLRSSSVVRNDMSRQAFPDIQPIGYQSAVIAALNLLLPAQVEPVWNDGTNQVKIIRHAGFLIEYRQSSLASQPESAYRAFSELGGKRGWLYLDWLWQLRGLLDRLMGGPGMRGRQHEGEPGIGDIMDFYRVEALEPGRMMRLRAELKSPGAGWMEWRVRPQPEGGALLSQTAFFAPKGILGFLYWYLLYPFHCLIFAGLLRKIVRRADEIQQAG